MTTTTTSRRSRAGAVIAAVAVLGLGLSACSSDDSSDDADETSSTAEEPTSTAESTTTTREAVVNSGGSVEVVDFQYLPGNIEVEVGQSVTWTNTSDNRHTITSDDGRFPSSSPLQGDQSFVQAFPEAGAFPYYCTFHPEEMLGTILVQ